MNIQVRVMSAQAQTQLAAMQARVRDLERQLGAAGGAGAAFGNSVFGSERRMTRWGNQIQWAGRQVQTNFTYPLVIAGAAAVKWSLDNERAMTKIAKVYGDGTQSAQVMKNELAALDKAFVALSERFGVNQAAVKEVAAGWAAAGASGVALAKSTETTLKTMVLGEMDAVKATEALISIQAQYGLSSKQLSDVVAQLNIVENQTGVSLSGLVEGFQRAAGVARSAGIDTRHLAAMIAAISPAAGSAAQAGNGLKTIISRLLAPTKDATKIMGLMGINTKSLAFNSLNATQRLELMGKKFADLSDAQKAVVSATLASRYQINRFDVLMREINSNTGFYHKALEATADRTRYLRVAQQELNQVLNSSPQKLKIVWTMLQNAMVDIIQPLIPMILAVANAARILVEDFNKLDPSVQKLILGMAVFLALVGPIVRYIGAWATLLGFLSIGFSGLLKVMTPVVTLMGFLLKAPFTMLASGISALGGAAVVAARGLFTAAAASLMFVRTLTFASVVATMRGAFATIMGFFSAIGAAFTFTFRAMLIAVPVFMAELASGVLRGFAFIRVGFTAAMSAFAAVSGGLWVALVAGWEGILIGGAGAIGAIWRGMFALMEGILVGGSALLGGAWRAMSSLLIGLTISFTGTIVRLWGLMVVGIRLLGPALLAAITNPWTLVVAIVLGAAYAFRDDIAHVWTEIVRFTQDAFNALPESIANAMSATVQVIAAAAQQIYEWFSYINPFAHHSPSLVEEVTRGMKVIKDQFGKLKVVSAPLDAAKAKLAGFKTEIRSQEQVVLNWKNAVASANAVLDAAKKKLDALQAAASKIGDALDAAKQSLDTWANTPIQGMKAMGDAIFNNEMAQKRLQLQMMKMEDVIGPLDKLQNKMSAINGEIEMLSGKRAELRNAGAGSDILGAYTSQIGSLKGQQGGISSQVASLQKMQDQLDKLQRTAQRLDLVQSLRFDPLKKAIDEAANSMREMPFGTILANVKANRAEVNRLQAAYDSANAAVKNQQAVVDGLTVSHDRLSAKYDAENAKLQQMKLNYNKLNDEVVKANRALSAASDARLGKKKKPPKGPADSAAVAAFKAGAGANFPDVGGAGMQLGREFPNIKDQSGLIDQFTKDIAKQTADMFAGFDMFKPIRDMWDKTWAWITVHIAPAVTSVIQALKDAFSGSGNVGSALMDRLRPTIELIQNVGQTIWKWLGQIWDLIGPEVKKTVGIIIKFIVDLWNNVGPQLAKLGQLWDPFIEAVGHVWNLLKPFVQFILVVLLGALKILWSTANGILGPLFTMIAKVLGNVLQVVINVVKLILDLINGDWKKAWHDAQQIVAGVVAAIGNIIKGAWNIILGAVKGFVMGIVNFFKWLWDMLVGHSIIPDMIRAIIKWFLSLPGSAIAAVASLIPRFGAWARGVWDNGIAWMKKKWTELKDWLSRVPNSFIVTLAILIVKFGTWARQVWDNGIAWMKRGWANLKAWASGIPNSFIGTISSLIGKLGALGKSAFTSLYNSLHNLWSGTISPWLGRLPGAAADKLKGIGGAVANAVRGAVKGAFDWINKNVIGNVNKVTGAFHVTIPSLPHFASGGIIPGKPTKKDSVLVAARPGEGILIPEAVQALGGPRGIGHLNKMFAMGHPAAAFGALQGDGFQHFALGGVVGSVVGAAKAIASKVGDWIQQGAGFALDHVLAPVSGVMRTIMPNGFPEDFMVSIIDRWRSGAKAWGTKQEATMPFGFGNHGRATVNNIKDWLGTKKGLPYVWGAAGPNTFDCSGLVGAVYGFLRGLLGSGRGARFFTTTTIGPQPGLIPGMGPGLNIGVTAGTGHMAGNLAGLPFEATPPRVKIGSSAKPVIQFARKFHMDQGGWLPPGGHNIFNHTGDPEAVLTGTQWRAIMDAERAFGAFTTAMLKGGGAGVLAAANARARAGSDRASGSLAGDGRGGDMTVHIHGDLSFPNIDNKASAATFLQNLETMARGQ